MSWLYALIYNGFLIIFYLCDSATQEFISEDKLKPNTTESLFLYYTANIWESNTK